MAVLMRVEPVWDYDGIPMAQDNFDDDDDDEKSVS